MITPDQAAEFISRIDSGYYGNVAMNQKISEAFRDIQIMIEAYQSNLSDLLYYRMVKCHHCGHYTMADEVVCHVCGRPLPISEEQEEIEDGGGND